MGGEIDLVTLKRNMDDAQAAVRAFDPNNAMREANLAYHQASNAYYTAKNLAEGRAIVERLVGHTVVAVRQQFSGPGHTEVRSDGEDALDAGYEIVLDNGVTISAAYLDEGGDGQLEIGFATK